MTSPVPGDRTRILQLDILRGVAILLVLASHPAIRPEITHLFLPIAKFGPQFGWSGVDLFFVLSGFLVGGLLFKELKTRSKLDAWRFVIRRGFKIWPAYYVFLTFLFVRELATHRTIVTAFRELLPNLVHLQNYFHSLALHTWSLAVEEHFYLALPCILLVITQGSKGKLENLRAIPFATIALIITCITARYFNHSGLVPQTHLRIDSLFWGVSLAYLYHFEPNILQPISRRPFAFILLGAALISPMLFVPPHNVFVYTLGYTCLYVGYGFILLSLLYTPLDSGRIGAMMQGRIMQIVAFIGFHSYSIYLWHISLGRKPAEMLGIRLTRFLPGDVTWLIVMTVYVILAVGNGALLGKLIEAPALRLRDRLFPARAAAPAEEQPAELRRSGPIECLEDLVERSLLPS